MNTQNAPVHIRLWHRDFWIVSISNLMLTMSVTMLIPVFPLWMRLHEGMTDGESGAAMALFAFGLFLFGPICSWLVQHYRRNMVCVVSELLLAVLIWLSGQIVSSPVACLCLLRFCQGAAFGLAQMVLTSTLIIDTCESHQRTEANHSATWFGRFALSLGPLLGLLIWKMASATLIFSVSALLCCVSAILILTITFPFRTHEDNVPVFSLDRFLLLQGIPLFANLLLVTVGIGMILSLALSEHFYGLLMVGFLLALLAQNFVFRDAELKSEVMSGMLLLIAAVLIFLNAPRSPLGSPLLGLGLGLIGARFLLFFVKLSRHCQRGTSQSTFILGWESGLAVGVGAGLAVGNTNTILYAVLVVFLIALGMYHFYTHRWFIHNKNR